MQSQLMNKLKKDWAIFTLNGKLIVMEYILNLKICQWLCSKIVYDAVN